MKPSWMRAAAALMVLFPLIGVALGVGIVRAQDDAPAPGLALPIFGPIDGDDGTFQGTVSRLEFSNDGDDLTLTGLLNGIVSIGDDSVRITDEEFETPVEPSVAGAVVPDEVKDEDEVKAEFEDEDGDEVKEEDEVKGEFEDEDEDDSAARPGALRAYVQDNPTQPEPDEGKCDVLYLDIQPITLNLLGLEVLTSRITLDVNAIPGDGNLAGNLVCSLAGLLDGLPDTMGQVTDQLNEIVTEAGGTTDEEDGLGALPVFGTFEDENGETGTFQGTISDVEFSDDDGAILNGVLNGVTTVGDTTTRVVDQPVTSPVKPSVVGTIPPGQVGNGNNQQPTAVATVQATATSTGSDNPTLPEPDPDKCDVLFLDIQPITLNLLGLEVLTSRITVDVNAIPGEGNLAGNLVCALAGLLDGTPDAIAEITDRLNEIMNEIGVAPAEDEADAEATGTVEPDSDDVTAEATEAVDAGPTEAAAEPTEAVEPTQPPAEPTVAPEPTQPPAEPTQPPAEPTAPPAEPTPTG